MDHPVLKEIQAFGYPSEYRDYEPVFVDSFGYEVYPGEEYFDFDGERYLKEELSGDAIEILEKHGADLCIAE